MSEEPRRNAYQFFLRRFMDDYRSKGTVEGVRPRDAQHALQLARAAARKKARRE